MRVLKGAAAVVLGAVLLLAASFAAVAQGLEAALAKFTSDSYTETDAAIADIAASGHPRAAALIEALQDGRLYVSEDKRVLWRDHAGQLLEAATGNAVDLGAAGTGKPVRLNNRTRRSLETALGGPHLRRAGQTFRGGAGGVQIQGRQGAAGTRNRAAAGDRCRHQARASGGPGGGRAQYPRRQGQRQDRGGRHHQGPRRPGCACPARRP